MNSILWNEEMNLGWDDLSISLIEKSKDFSKLLFGITQFSFNQDSIQLISKDCLDRFINIVQLIADITKDGCIYKYEDIDDTIQNPIKLNGWILIGSVTETVLQLFISFYLDDYHNSKWQIWENVNTEKVKTTLNNSIQGLINEGILSSSQARSIKDAIKDTLKEHTKEHPIQRVMLDELIQLYTKLELFDADEIEYLKLIQSNRNGIHSFQNRKIGNWNDFMNSVRFFIYLLDWVLSRIPDIPDYDDYI